MKYAVEISPTSTGHSAHAPDLPGCAAAAGSYEETLALITEAIVLHIGMIREHGEAVPEPSTQCEYAAIPPSTEDDVPYVVNQHRREER